MNKQLQISFARVAAAAGGIGIVALAAIAPAMAQYNYRLAVPAGKTVPIVLEKQLSSNRSWQGEHFSAVVANSGARPNNFYNNSFPEGTHIYGHVTAAIPQRGSNTGFLALAYDYAVLPNGHRIALHAVPAGEGSHSYNVQSDGRIVGTSKATGTAEKDAGIGAAAGLVGDLLLNHGKVNLTHVLAGGAAGYGVSTINKAKNAAQNVTLGTGTKIGMKMVDPVYLGGHGG